MLAICPLASLARGEAHRVASDPPIAVFHTEDGELFAIDDTCTHQDASLADGWLEGDEIECPLHASRFSLRTGHVDAPPAKRPVRTHEVSVDAAGMINVLAVRRRPQPPAGSVKHVAVIGASLAGLSAASALRKQGFDGAVTILGAERAPALRPPAAVEGVPRRRGDRRPSSPWRPTDEDLSAEWRLGVSATRLDVAAGRVELDDGSAVVADGVVIATGARARTLPGTARDGRRAHAAHARRRPGAAGGAGARDPPDRHRSRVHRRRGRLHGPRARLPGHRPGGGTHAAVRSAGRPDGRCWSRGCTPSTG